MDKKEMFEKITQKKEFSQLPKKDVEMVFDKFDSDKYLDEEKIKLTRDLLRKVYSVFASQKLLKLKDKDLEWILKKHISTKERFPYYNAVYGKIFEDVPIGNVVVFDFGAGINGIGYEYFPEKFNINYIGVEAMRQLVDLMNYSFKKEHLDKNAKAIHESLFDLPKIKILLKNQRGFKVVFLFKVLDSLEMVKPDYSKIFLKDIVPLVDKAVVSFATRSLVKRTKFKVNRNWIFNFIKENFNILDEFEFGSEKYVVFRKK